jgi:hypothetical protein
MKYQILALLSLVALVGCSSYVDESKIEGYFLDTKNMGKEYPYVIIDGQKLEYNEEKEWYYYADTDIPALWLEYQNKFGKISRMLASVTRYDKQTKRWQDYRDGAWRDRPASDQLPPPEHDDGQLDNTYNWIGK